MNKTKKKLIKYAQKLQLLMRRPLRGAFRPRHRATRSNLFLGLTFTLFSMILSACVTLAPKKFSQYKEGEWAGKVLVKNKREAKSGIVNINIRAIDGEQLRIDVTSTMGTHLASILLVGDQIEYLNIVDRSVYKGAASRESLKDILPIPLEPQALYNILFDRGFENKNWSCTSDKKGFVLSCKDLKSGLTIVWVSREGDKRTIGFETVSASVQMSLYEFKPKVSNPEKVFQLKAPSSFKIKKR